MAVAAAAAIAAVTDNLEKRFDVEIFFREKFGFEISFFDILVKILRSYAFF